MRALNTQVNESSVRNELGFKQRDFAGFESKCDVRICFDSSSQMM